MDLTSSTSSSSLIGSSLASDSQTSTRDNSTSDPNSLEHWMELPKMDNIVDVVSVVCSTAVIFGGIIPYIPQYLKIKSSNSSEGFSPYVCLTLLLANILRIAFWFGHHFELPLLIQSFVMIIGMLALMEICVRVRRRSSSYIISSLGTSRSLQSNRNRSSLIGKLILRFSYNFRNGTTRNGISNTHTNGVTANVDDDEDDREQSVGMLSSVNNESTPIYSVASVTPTRLPPVVSSQNDPAPVQSSYHNQHQQLPQPLNQQHQPEDTIESTVVRSDEILQSPNVLSDTETQHSQLQGTYMA